MDGTGRVLTLNHSEGLANQQDLDSQLSFRLPMLPTPAGQAELRSLAALCVHPGRGTHDDGHAG
jgi:hypothetical protein